MGNEQGKQKDQQIKQIFLNKQQIEILMLKVQGHIELMKNKRCVQVQNKVKDLSKMIQSPQRNREEEMHKMISLQQDENFVAGCDIVIRYLNILKDRSLLIEQSRGQISQLEELLPFILSISWASSQLSHSSMKEYNEKISGLFGADLFQVAQTSDKVDPELKKMFKVHLNYNPDLIEVMKKFSQVTQISMEEINRVGHNLCDPTQQNQQQLQQQYESLQQPQHTVLGTYSSSNQQPSDSQIKQESSFQYPDQSKIGQNQQFQQPQQQQQPNIPSTMAYPEQSQQFQPGYLQQQQNQQQGFQQPQYQQQQGFQQPQQQQQQGFQQPQQYQQGFQQPQQYQQQGFQQPQQDQYNNNQQMPVNNNNQTNNDLADLDKLLGGDSTDNYVPAQAFKSQVQPQQQQQMDQQKQAELEREKQEYIRQLQQQNQLQDQPMNNQQQFSNPYSEQNSQYNEQQNQNNNQQQYAQIDGQTGNVNFQRGNSFEEDKDQNNVQKENPDDLFNNQQDQQIYPGFEQSQQIDHSKIINQINSNHEQIQQGIEQQQRESNTSQQSNQQAPSQLTMLQQLQNLSNNNNQNQN